MKYKSIREILQKQPDINTITDENILDLTYGIKFFELYNEPKDQIDFWNAAYPKLISRLIELEKKAKEVKCNTNTTTTVCGQLWEQCERCGCEPILLSTMLCENCSK